MKTQVAKKEEVTRDWYLVDVDNKVLGRVATQIANVLRGKNKPTFTPSVDTGDFVIVVNAEKIARPTTATPRTRAASRRSLPAS